MSSTFALNRFARRLFTAIALLLAFTAGGWLASAAPPEHMPLWSGPAPVGGGTFTNESAFITLIRPEKPNGAAMVICPGGGYGGLVTGPEGTGIAAWLNRHGITGVVLEYRLPHGRSLVPLLDAQQAIRTVRARAAEWSLDPKKIGIMGFSAGGHLAATAATHFDLGNTSSTNLIEQKSSRPDFAILVYPVISFGDKGHGGSRANLLGANPTAQEIESFSNERQVTSKTPPAFLAHAVDDRVVSVENSRLFYQSLQNHGVEGRLLELPTGDHGLNGYQGPMWDAWQRESLRWLVSRGVIPMDAGPPAPAYLSYPSMTNGPQRVQLLPGQDGVVFTLYGAPGELAPLKEVVEVMRREHLGNGFDPGPGLSPNTPAINSYLTTLGWPLMLYSGADMQINGGRALFGRAQEDVLRPLDQAGIFTAYQLGEWGYYFHNLSCRESWMRDVYGSEFDQFKHLLKPSGLAGYDRMPSNKRECYEAVKYYFQCRNRDLLGRVISVTGHSHYEAYVGEWGARCIGLEIGENIAFTQSKLAFARGASRAWQKPWSSQISPWFSGSVTTSGPLRREAGGTRGLDAGHSLSLYERLWLHSWFAGAAMVTPENSIATFFEHPEAPWTLTEHGRKASAVFPFMRNHDRGIPYTPVAVVLDHLAGYNAYMDKPWGILESTPGDREIRDLFDHQLFPGSDHIHTRADPVNPEKSYLVPTPFGELFDVVLTSVPMEVLPTYPVILLAGDIEFDPAFSGELEKAVRRGSHLLISQRHRATLGAQFDRLMAQGDVEILEPWINPATGRSTAISNKRLEHLNRELLPVEINGGPVEYQFNRTSAGWVVELIHNGGITKKPDQPVTIESNASVHVGLRPKRAFESVREWRGGQTFDHQNEIELVLEPGGIRYIEFSGEPR